MKVVIVFNHPYEGSFGNAILNAVTSGLKDANHEVDLMHLDNDRFNPVMSKADLKAFVEHKPVDPQVIAYNERLEKADHLIFIFPIWWDLMPAMTKGFVDRVLTPGVVYDHHPRGFGLIPLLKNLKGVTVITTMNKPKIMYSLIIGNLIKKAMIKSVFKTMGYKNLKWISYNMVKAVSQEKRVKWITDIENRFSKFS
ncbi:FMN-dependent NADH-azoreductase [Pedobacter sp. Bi27]|uniref:NAD(P)H-dependent oxidoreductase n=1 Tax=unclassified Pedobacter TaxID=2628915 RepID=UPI001D6DE5DC|nr:MULTISPECIES: NAD(P)H-dependent oxidoreductase [unclassified Pedobacter]CAH0136101.1 FMN-dependent NADH-azoreductase [Pedobacter sp. Bi36]CAH0191654.1 FMN-dependent NADH-azoreductase [Pedobacter sp. Bi126]CAH0250815.1 FMN-dependent NADH-azoreductase [Pedobacter sp. Bi27]